MGIAWTDYNSDGYLDAYVTRIHTSSLYQNNAGVFTDIAEQAGALRNGMSWGIVAADFDLDRDEDLFIVNTYTFDQTNPSFLYENRGGWFANVAPAAGVSFRQDAFGTASGDFNRDGYPDLVISNTNGRHRLLLNAGEVEGRYARIKLEGHETNRMAIGARIRVVTDSTIQHRFVSGGDGYCSQQSQVLHVGLGEATQIDTLDVYWRPDFTERFTNLPPDSLYHIIEGHGIATNAQAELTIPSEFRLEQNYPNPFHTTTTFQFYLAQPTMVRLDVYDVLGRPVQTLRNELVPAGTHQQTFGAEGFPPGVYWYRAVAGTQVRIKKMVVQ